MVHEVAHLIMFDLQEQSLPDRSPYGNGAPRDLPMVTDPATTPERQTHQVAFGLGVAVAYGLLMQLNVVFGLFFGLGAVSLVRGAGLLAMNRLRQPATAPREAIATPLVQRT
mgnify:CR=1 FL=1